MRWLSPAIVVPHQGLDFYTTAAKIARCLSTCPCTTQFDSSTDLYNITSRVNLASRVAGVHHDIKMRDASLKLPPQPKTYFGGELFHVRIYNKRVAKRSTEKKGGGHSNFIPQALHKENPKKTKTGAPAKGTEGCRSACPARPPARPLSDGLFVSIERASSPTKRLLLSAEQPACTSAPHNSNRKEKGAGLSLPPSIRNTRPACSLW